MFTVYKYDTVLSSNVLKIYTDEITDNFQISDSQLSNTNIAKENKTKSTKS